VLEFRAPRWDSAALLPFAFAIFSHYHFQRKGIFTNSLAGNSPFISETISWKTSTTTHTASWVAQRIHEEPIPTAIGVLSAWTHPKRYKEADEITIEQLNQLTDEEVMLALKEFTQPKQYIQGTGGNKLSIHTIFTSLDKQTIIETNA
jgi:hypothetical protein